VSIYVIKGVVLLIIKTECVHVLTISFVSIVFVISNIYSSYALGRVYCIEPAGSGRCDLFTGVKKILHPRAVIKYGTQRLVLCPSSEAID